MAYAIAGARPAGDRPFRIHAAHESEMSNTHDLVVKLMTLPGNWLLLAGLGFLIEIMTSIAFDEHCHNPLPVFSQAPSSHIWLIAKNVARCAHVKSIAKISLIEKLMQN